MKVLALTVLAAVSCLAQLDYVLHPKENILIRAPQSTSLNGRIFQIQPDGFVTLPSLGRIRVDGVAVKDLEKQLASRLKRNLSDSSQVTIHVVNSRSTNSSVAPPSTNK
jgi:protein involved in polysaccharide export with SLBB domain